MLITFNCYNQGNLGHNIVVVFFRPMMCYNSDKGTDYRGTVSVTKSGQTCKPWHLTFDQRGFVRNKGFELFGGHNYCRNPEGPEQEDEPWCYTNDPR